MEHINVNLVPGGIPSICHVSQYDDNERVIRAHLFDGILPHTLSGTETIILSMRKPDLSRHVYNLENSSSDYIDIVTTCDMCSVAGESECELIITNESSVIGTANFKMKIESDAYGDSLVVKSVSGPIATFETDLAEDLIKLDVDLEPVQDLHGYDYPWPAGGGKNIACLSEETLDNSQRITIDYLDENNLNFTVDGTYARCMYKVKAKAGSTVTVSFKAQGIEGAYNRVNFNPQNSYSNYQPWGGHNISADALNTYTKTFTLEVDDFYVGFYWTANSDTGAPIVRDFQVEIGSSATSFAPYENICPISGHDSAQLFRTGKNLLDTRQESIPQYAGGPGTYAGVTYSPNPDGSITINGTSTGASVLFFDPVTLNPIVSYPFPTWKYTNNRYTLSVTDEWGLVTGDVYIQATVKKIKDDSIVSRQRLTASVFTRSFTVREDEYIADAFVRLSSGASASNINIKIQLELGSTATDYEPYTSEPTPVTVQFGQTVYGGTLDSASRRLRVDTRYMIFDGTQEVGRVNWRPLSNSVGWLYRPDITPNIRNYVIDESNLPSCKLKSNKLQTVVYGGAQGLYGKDSPCISLVGTEYLGLGMRVNDTSLTNATAINNWLSQNPIEVIYELSEPFFIDLTQVQTASIESSPVASFETTLAMPLNTSEHSFSCSQAEGTPTPDSPIPITGVSEITAYRTGKNLAQPYTERTSNNGINYEVSSDGKIHAYGTSTSSSYNGSNLSYNDAPWHLKAGSYVFSSFGMSATGGAQGYVSIGVRKANGDLTNYTLRNESKTVTIDEDCHVFYWIYTGNGRTIDEYISIQIELSSSATPYEPYNGESITVSLGGTYYGGKLVQSEDGSRKIVLSYAQLVLSSANANIINRVNANKYRVFNADCGAKITGSDYADIKCNKMSSQTGTTNDNRCYINSTGDIRMNFASEYDTVADMIAAIESITVVYPIETPIEINLPDGDPLTTIAGENNVYCNTGDTAVKYYYNMVSDPIRIPALVGENNVYSDAGDVTVEYYAIEEG